jgi:arylsulfatase A-like enzyme
LLLALASILAGRARGETPNLVLIVWDDPSHAFAEPAREGASPAPRSTPRPTPRLDALLAEGVRFPRGTQVAERGRPSAAVLLTGKLPHQNGVTYQSGPKPIPPAETLMALLKTRGYAGLHVGKLREGTPAEFGFVRELPNDLTGQETAAFVAEVAPRQPLFVWWAPALPPGGGAAELDRSLGALLDALEASAPGADTLFAFVTNGEPLPKGSVAREASAERMRSPLALVRRGKLAPAQREERVTPLDLFPTLLEAAGIPAPAAAGRSLLPLVGGAPWEARTVGAAFFPRQPKAGTRGGADPVRDLKALVAYAGRFKYELYLEDIGVRYDEALERFQIECSAGDQRLFDVEADPAEAKDLFASTAHAETLVAMREATLAWWRASGARDFTMPFLPPALGPAPKEARPNIVLVVADDMDYEHLGFMGNRRVRTPTLDELARTGVVFPAACVPMSKCRPSLAALLSGRWPHQNGVYDNETARTLARRDSLPNLLKAAGYATFQGGKFWEGSQLSMGFLEPKDVDAVFESFVRKGQDELFAFVERYHEERPFFVWWAPMLPHVPYDPPERLREAFRKTEVPVPAGIVGEAAEFEAEERTLYAMGAWLDEGLAALRAELARQGELEDTLFVFLIDNGHANGFPSKGTAFEKGLRTPVVVSWPKGIAGGRTSPELVSSLDLYRTLLAYAGVEAPATAEGISLKPTLDGAAQHTRDALYGAIYHYRDRQGPPRAERDVLGLWARTARWKFVLYLRDLTPEGAGIHHAFAPFPARKRGDVDLFDLESDPHEQHDLAGDSSHAALLDELREGCLAWWKATGGGDLDLP